MDREKVIKGLECCTSGNRCSGNCPYDDEYDDFDDCTSELAKDAIETIKEQQAEIERLNALLKEQQAETKRLTPSGEWKRMSDLPIEIDDRFECSNCGNVVHYHDRINLYTFNDYCGRCGAYNGFRV